MISDLNGHIRQYGLDQLSREMEVIISKLGRATKVASLGSANAVFFFVLTQVRK